MKLSQYGYEFKPEMLAKYPAENRDEARLMVVNRAKGTIEHRIFKDIIDYFDEGDLFVFNDTKVFPARLYGNKEKTGAEIEIFLLRELNRELRLWDVPFPRVLPGLLHRRGAVSLPKGISPLDLVQFF